MHSRGCNDRQDDREVCDARRGTDLPHGGGPARAQQPALIHNVVLTDYAHSTFADGALHAQNLWVPFLRGYVQADYVDLMKWCQEGHQCRQSKPKNEIRFQQIEDLLLQKDWRLEFGSGFLRMFRGSKPSQPRAPDQTEAGPIPLSATPDASSRLEESPVRVTRDGS